MNGAAWTRPLVAAGVVAIAVLALAGWTRPRLAVEAWYAAALFWSNLSLGALALLMIHHLTGGQWGWYLRPLLIAAAAALPLVLVAYVPLLVAVEALFPWTGAPETLAEVVRRKLGYLNVPFFLLRAALYATIWLTLLYLLGGGRRSVTERRRGIAAAGLILYTISITFFGVDWVHSLEPKFYSSDIGYVMGTGQALGALAFTVLAATWLGRRAGDRAPPYHDLGNLLLAAVMLWAYIFFTKYLIIWITDLPHEIEWYLRRREGVWLWLTLALVTLQFCLPFCALLFRTVKRDPRLLGTVAAVVLAAHLLQALWLVLPSFTEQPAGGAVLRVAILPAAVVALGAPWLLLVASRLGITVRLTEEATHG